MSEATTSQKTAVATDAEVDYNHNISKSFDEVVADIDTHFWWPGWRPWHAIGIAMIGLAFIGSTFDATGSMGALGLFAGIGWWFYGTRYINQEYGSVLSVYRGNAEAEARSCLGLDDEKTNYYTLQKMNGRAVLVDPYKEYLPTVLAVSDSSCAFYSDTKLDMVNLNMEVGEDTTEYFYNNITNVPYEEPFFTITTNDGQEHQYRSSRSPDDALADLQEQLRSHHR
jgi:hypothetical protein